MKTACNTGREEFTTRTINDHIGAVIAEIDNSEESFDNINTQRNNIPDQIWDSNVSQTNQEDLTGPRSVKNHDEINTNSNDYHSKKYNESNKSKV